MCKHQTCPQALWFHVIISFWSSQLKISKQSCSSGCRLPPLFSWLDQSFCGVFRALLNTQVSNQVNYSAVIQCKWQPPGSSRPGPLLGDAGLPLSDRLLFCQTPPDLTCHLSPSTLEQCRSADAREHGRVCVCLEGVCHLFSYTVRSVLKVVERGEFVRSSGNTMIWWFISISSLVQ